MISISDYYSGPNEIYDVSAENYLGASTGSMFAWGLAQLIGLVRACLRVGTGFSLLLPKRLAQQIVWVLVF